MFYFINLLLVLLHVIRVQPTGFKIVKMSSKMCHISSCIIYLKNVIPSTNPPERNKAAGALIEVHNTT